MGNYLFCPPYEYILFFFLECMIYKLVFMLFQFVVVYSVNIQQQSVAIALWLMFIRDYNLT